MKTKTKSILAIIFAMSLASCSTTSFYQVYRTNYSDKIVSKDNTLVYEDENCKVIYNLWGEGGNIGFRIYNKTDEIMLLKLKESFFVLNGIANDYYKNRVFTSSKSAGATRSRSTTASKSVTNISTYDLLQTDKIQATGSLGLITSSAYSVSYNESDVVVIPPKTAKIITEYRINESLYRDCEMLRYPRVGQIKTKTFSRTDSPFVFSNLISYSIGASDKSIEFENDFYVAEITNYPETALIESKFEEFCGQESVTKTKYFKEIHPNKFYLYYRKGADSMKH